MKKRLSTQCGRGLCCYKYSSGYTTMDQNSLLYATITTTTTAYCIVNVKYFFEYEGHI